MSVVPALAYVPPDTRAAPKKEGQWVSLSRQESELVLQLCQRQRSRLPSYLLSSQRERALLDDLIQKLA